MNFRFPRLLLLLCTVVLSGCALFEPGGPSAAITVKGHSRSQVQDVVERVFIDEGYKPYTRMLDGIMFEKEASKSDRLLYGDWGDGQVTQRVKVTISPDKEDYFRLRCMSFVAREAHDVSFEDQH